MNALRRKVPGRDMHVVVLVCTPDEVRFLIDSVDAFARAERLELRRPRIEPGPLREVLVEGAYGKLS